MFSMVATICHITATGDTANTMIELIGQLLAADYQALVFHLSRKRVLRTMRAEVESEIRIMRFKFE